MSQVDVERFLGRLITDPGFRSRVVHSLDSAACREGFVFSAEEKFILNSIDVSPFGHVAEALDDSIKRA